MLEHLRPVLPMLRYLMPGNKVEFWPLGGTAAAPPLAKGLVALGTELAVKGGAEAATAALDEAAMFPSLLSLLRCVLLPDSRSISSIASIEAMGALPLKKVKYPFSICH